MDGVADIDIDGVGVKEGVTEIDGVELILIEGVGLTEGVTEGVALVEGVTEGVGVDDTEIDGWEQTREVSDIFVHPDYNNHDIDYDFTLIKLAEPVELNDHVAPACFQSEEDDLASTFPPGYYFLTIFLLERGRVGVQLGIPFLTSYLA